MPSEDSFTIKLDTSSSGAANVDYVALRDLTASIKDLTSQLRRRPTSTENNVRRMASVTRSPESVQERISRISGITKNENDYNKLTAQIMRQSTAATRASNAAQRNWRRDFMNAGSSDFNYRLGDTLNRRRMQQQISQDRMRTAAGVGLVGTYAADRYLQVGGQIGTTLASSNPFTNNYDYGSTLQNLMNLKQQQQNALVTGGATAIGGIINGSRGAAIGGALSTIYNASSTANTSETAAAKQFALNNIMQREAFNATHSARLSNEYAPTQAQYGLQTIMGQTTSVYTKNFKEMDKLTNYIIAAQVPMSQVPGLMAQVGLAEARDKGGFNFSRIANTAVAYNADISAVMPTYNSLRNSGFNIEQSRDLAARIQGSFNGAMQGQAIGSFLGQNPIAMEVQNKIFKQQTGTSVWGALTNGSGFFQKALNTRDNIAQGIKVSDTDRKQAVLASILASEVGSPMEAFAWGVAKKQNIPNLNKDISPSQMQTDAFEQLSGNKERAKLAGGMTTSDYLRDLSDATKTTSASLKDFTDSLQEASAKILNMIGLNPNGDQAGGGIIRRSANTGATRSTVGSRRSP